MWKIRRAEQFYTNHLSQFFALVLHDFLFENEEKTI